MSIEYLRLKGFKSFGTSCEFTFSDGLTAIVGPNGSGKSNILDAMRWILGESSPTTLRIRNQSDLIFQGSASTEQAKEAEVILKLSHKGPSEVFSESGGSGVLRRQYAADSGSVLQVDGTRIRMQDLSDFKARFMMEGDSFAFIGQGEVSEAIHQRPMERRHHLELLFGIDRYRKRREETNRKLEEATAEMQRINTLVSELEARRAEIAPEVAVAVEAKGILDNLENVRRDYYFSRRLTLEKKEQEHRSRLQLASEHEDTVRLWRELWLSAAAALEDKLLREGFDEQEYITREHDLAARKETLRRQSYSAATRVKGIRESRDGLEAEAEQTATALSAVTAEMEKTRREEAALAQELAGKRAAFEDVLRRLEEGRATAERERVRRQALRDSHAEKTLARSKLEARRKALASSGEESGRELSRLEEQRAALAAETAKLEQELAVLEKQHEKLSLDYSDVYAACQKYAASRHQLSQELVRREAELDAIKENTESSIYPRPTSFLLSASRLGRMASKPEVVAEAFSCPRNIAPALEAYLGGRQYWLLVHTFDEAREGIELLKQRSAGRVTYLPLERCRPRFPDSRFRLPVSGVVGWCIELITARSPWEPALQHLLGDLLVVEDYGLGSSMVKDGAKFPIATLDGEVFSPAGTVSGGRSNQGGGAIGHNQRITELSVDIDSLKRKIKELESEFARAEKREQKAAAERDELGAKVTHGKSALAASQKNLAGIEADMERAGRETSESSQEAAQIDAELASLAGQIAALEGELAGLPDFAGEPGAAESPSFVGAARGELELAEERMKGTSNMLARILKERGDLEERRAAADAELIKGRAEEKSMKDQIALLGREQFAVWSEARDVRAALEAERGKARKVHARLERLRAREKKAESNVTALAAEIAALNERVAAARSDIEELQAQWDEKYPYDAREAVKIEGERDGAAGLKATMAAMRRLESELRALGAYNLGALSEDESLTARVDFLSEQLEDVRTGAGELKKLIDETDTQVEFLFSQKMTDIDDRFNKLFQRLFSGGEAHLTLQEGTSLWDRGVEINARPPGKLLQNISQLSGGEQSLTAIAHLFAALEVAGMPLAVLDEVDAALDEYNLIRFADLAKEYSKRLQLLVMTHRRTTMERADLIYGVTMVEAGLSKIVGINLDDYR